VKIKIHKTIILPVVLYGCETLSLTLREEHRWRVFENRVLRRIFGPKRDEVTSGWRKEDLGVDGRTTLRWILGKKGLGMWIGLIWLRIGTGGKPL
jgi:hypothetical protein